MRYPWFWLLGFLFVAFAFAGTRPLGEPDEGRYGESAREMLVTGDWLVPRLQGQAHLTKPPMTYWLLGGTMRLAGINEWGVRLPVALAFFLTILCVVELARTWKMSATAARAAGLIFATSLLPFVAGHLATTDMILTFWETFGILALWKVWRGAPYAAVWRWAFWMAFAGAFLTKGPPGWLPLLAVIVFYYAAKAPRLQGRIFSIPAFFVFLFLSLSWFLVLLYRDPELWQYFLGDEVYGRVFSREHGREKSWWFYLVAVAFGLTPWIFLWPGLVRGALVDIKPELAGRGAFPSFTRLRALVHDAWQRTHTHREIHFFSFLWFMLTHAIAFVAFKLYHFWYRLRRCEDIKFFSFLWFFLPLAIFQLSNSKMFFYVVPLFVPLSIWSGQLLARMWPALLPTAPRLRKWALAGAAVWLVAALGFVACPEVTGLTNSHRRVALQTRDFARATDGESLFAIEGPPIHSLSFYSGLELRELDENANQVLTYLRKKMEGGKPALLVMKKKKISKLADTGYKIIAQDDEIAILRVSPTAP